MNSGIVAGTRIGRCVQAQHYIFKSTRKFGTSAISKHGKKNENAKKETTIDKLTSTLFGPWWPKSEGSFFEEEIHSDIGPKMSAEDLVENTKYLNSSSKTQGAIRKKQQNITGTNKVPRHMHMLAREFIHNSLYNPNYGYFSKQAMIFSLKEPYEFSKIRDTNELLSIVGDLYRHMEKELDSVETIPRQIWHTPTELLKPWYGYSIANCIVDSYKKDLAKRKENGDTESGKHDGLVVYEIGAGNGTLMLDILKYIKENEPEIFKDMEYKIIEISPRLARKQLSRLHDEGKGELESKIKIHNKSIFDWDMPENRPCFVLALEVVDNFSHDVIRYDSTTFEPYQSLVYVDKEGEFHEKLEPVSDPLIVEFLDVCKKVNYVSPLLKYPFIKRQLTKLPFAHNATRPEFLPTNLYKMCKLLSTHFPKHRLILSDFYKLPDTIEGINGPVVQTRYRGNMVPCSTFRVQPGWFDIFFPTNFELLKKIYTHTRKTAASAGGSYDSEEPVVLTQGEFVTKYADLSKTKTRSGENPMSMLYENNKFILT